MINNFMILLLLLLLLILLLVVVVVNIEPVEKIYVSQDIRTQILIRFDTF